MGKRAKRRRAAAAAAAPAPVVVQDAVPPPHQRIRGEDKLLRNASPLLANATTGMGGPGDKNVGAEFQPTFINAALAELLYTQSWAAAKLINIPVEDMWVRGRQWTGDDGEDTVKRMRKAIKELKAEKRIQKAMIAGRLHGTGLAIICSRTRPLTTELVPDQVKEGEIANIWVTDRWSSSIDAWFVDPQKPNYGDPYMYRVAPRMGLYPQGAASSNALVWPGTNQGANLQVHHSRVLRFDGISPPLTEGWLYNNLERNWGLSVLTNALDDILRDSQTAAGVAHLIQEASIFMMKVQGLKEAISGGGTHGDTPDIQKLGEAINLYKSIYRTLFLDAADEANRINTSFSGLPDLLNSMVERLAAIGDIPRTRFLGASPAGMNATGESDMKNYAIRIASLQESMLEDPLEILDMVVARHAGLDKPPEYEWLPLMDLSKQEQAEAMAVRTKAVTEAYASGLVDENESRDALAQDEGWGELGPYAPAGPPEHLLPAPAINARYGIGQGAEGDGGKAAMKARKQKEKDAAARAKQQRQQRAAGGQRTATAT